MYNFGLDYVSWADPEILNGSCELYENYGPLKITVPDHNLRIGLGGPILQGNLG